MKKKDHDEENTPNIENKKDLDVEEKDLDVEGLDSEDLEEESTGILF